MSTYTIPGDLEERDQKVLRDLQTYVELLIDRQFTRAVKNRAMERAETQILRIRNGDFESADPNIPANSDLIAFYNKFENAPGETGTVLVGIWNEDAAVLLRRSTTSARREKSESARPDRRYP